MIVRFYSDTNFSLVLEAIGESMPEASLSSVKLEVALDENLYPEHLDALESLASEYSGDIYW